MKSAFLSILFMCSVIPIVNANSSSMKADELSFESCVSIAGRISGGDPELFRVAYVACIEGRMNQW